MAGRPVEWAALKDGPVAIDDQMSGRALGFGTLPEFDGIFRASSGSEMDDEQAPHRHIAAAVEEGGRRIVENMIGGNIHRGN
jgi:hypothetical protein